MSVKAVADKVASIVESKEYNAHSPTFNRFYLLSCLPGIADNANPEPICDWSATQANGTLPSPPSHTPTSPSGPCTNRAGSRGTSSLLCPLLYFPLLSLLLDHTSSLCPCSHTHRRLTTYLVLYSPHASGTSSSSPRTTAMRSRCAMPKPARRIRRIRVTLYHLSSWATKRTGMRLYRMRRRRKTKRRRRKARRAMWRRLCWI